MNRRKRKRKQKKNATIAFLKREKIKFSSVKMEQFFCIRFLH